MQDEFEQIIIVRGHDWCFNAFLGRKGSGEISLLTFEISLLKLFELEINAAEEAGRSVRASTVIFFGATWNLWHWRDIRRNSSGIIEHNTHTARGIF